MTMNILDENIRDPDWYQLRRWRLRMRKIGKDLGRVGTTDENVIPLLHQLRGVTFFTRDVDYCQRGLCHTAYCLVYLDVDPDQVAFFVRRFLRHPTFNSRAKRMGRVVRVQPMGLRVWRVQAPQAEEIPW